MKDRLKQANTLFHETRTKVDLSHEKAKKESHKKAPMKHTPRGR
jgi:hypothetical protein